MHSFVLSFSFALLFVYLFVYSCSLYSDNTDSQSITDTRLQPIIGRDLFAAVIAVMAEEKKALIGLEWELVDLAQSIYSLYVLGVDGTKQVTTNALSSKENNMSGGNGGGGGDMTGMSGGSGTSLMERDNTLHEQVEQLCMKRQAGFEEVGALNPYPRQVGAHCLLRLAWLLTCRVMAPFAICCIIFVCMSHVVIST